MAPQLHWTEYLVTFATAGAVIVALWLGLRDGSRRHREMKARREILASRIATLCNPIKTKLPTNPDRESQKLLLIAATRELLKDRSGTQELITATEAELKELAQDGWVLKDYERSELGSFIALLSRFEHTEDQEHKQALIQSILTGAHALTVMMVRAYATGNRERDPEEIRQQKHLKRQLRRKPKTSNSDR